MAPRLAGLVRYVLGNFVLLAGDGRPELRAPHSPPPSPTRGSPARGGLAGHGGLAPAEGDGPPESEAAALPGPAHPPAEDPQPATPPPSPAPGGPARPRTPPPPAPRARAPAGTPRLAEFRALPYFVAAAKDGDPRALAVLGFYWEHGLAGLPVSFARAEKLYTRAAVAGSPLAQARLAFLKMYGRPGVPINQADARTWRKRLSRRGRRALHWLKLAADAGIPAAQFCLASCFYNAIGTRKDDRRAFIWAGRAAARGHPGAQNLLGMLYVDGIPPDVPADPQTGLRWYIRSADQGEAAAIYNIATLFERGVAVEEDPAKAFRFYLRASEYGSISASNIVGLFYEQGVIGDAPDPARAADFYTRAAVQGHPFAQYNAGRCHVEGLGVPADPARALGFFERAAHQRHVLARMSLGVMWEDGIGVARPDKRRALEWFRRASYRGSREAQRRLKPVWACRVLVACRALLCSAPRPAPGAEGAGMWSLPFEIREHVVGWLNSECVLARGEMRAAVRYGRDRATLLAAPISPPANEGIARPMGRLSIAGEDGGTGVPARSTRKRNAGGERRPAPPPSLPAFLASCAIKSYADRRACSCPPGACGSLRHAMARYHEREDEPAEEEEEEGYEEVAGIVTGEDPASEDEGMSVGGGD